MIDNHLKNRDWPSPLGVLIPAYKAAQSLSRFLPTLVCRIPADNICVVDDGSGDDTAAVCEKMQIRCLVLPQNSGKGAALMHGFAQMTERFKWIITMDADGQHAVDDLEGFIQTIDSHPQAGIIIGAREISVKKMPASRVFSNATTSAILSIMTGRRIFDSQCGYRAYNASFVRNCLIRYSRFEMESEIILRASQHQRKIFFVPVQTLYCSDRSHIAHVKDTLRWVGAVVDVWLEIVSKRLFGDKSSKQ